LAVDDVIYTARIARAARKAATQRPRVQKASVPGAIAECSAFAHARIERTSGNENELRLPALRFKNRSKQINEVDPSNPQVAEIKACAHPTEDHPAALSRRESAGHESRDERTTVTRGRERGEEQASEPNQRLSPQQAGF